MKTRAMTRQEQVNQLVADWAGNPRWKGLERNYTAEAVVKLRGSFRMEYTLAKRGADKFWSMLNKGETVCALGAVTGNQAIQEVEAGLKAIYCSGWQVAGDANTSETMYPDQSLYPVDSVPALIRRINTALLRTDQIHWLEENTEIFLSFKSAFIILIGFLV